jgi:hypothetical protein
VTEETNLTAIDAEACFASARASARSGSLLAAMRRASSASASTRGACSSVWARSSSPGTRLHWSYLGQVERGQRNVTLHNILRIAKMLEIDPGKLLRGLRAPHEWPRSICPRPTTHRSHHQPEPQIVGTAPGYPVVGTGGAHMRAERRGSGIHREGNSYHVFQGVEAR